MSFMRPMAVAASPMRPPLRWLALVDVAKSCPSMAITEQMRSVSLFSCNALISASISSAACLRLSYERSPSERRMAGGRGDSLPAVSSDMFGSGAGARS